MTSWKRQLVLFLFLVFVSLATVVTVTGMTSSGQMRQEPPPTIIPRQLFGLHIHHLVEYPDVIETNTEWPTISFGSWRLWDAFVTWANLERQKGQWNFKTLDQYVELARENQVELVLPLALSPRWASARPDERSTYGPGHAAEPKNIEDWRNYVRTVAMRYKGQILYYEMWNEPNLPQFYSGSLETMLLLSREAYQILKEVDPNIQVVSPPPTHGDEGISWLDKYLSQGGGEYADIIGFHFYVVPSPPEAMLPLIEKVKAVMKKHDMGDKPLWNTEAGWLGDTLWPSDSEDAAAYVARSYILNWAAGVERFYWFGWDSGWGVSLKLTQEDHKTLASGGVAYQEIYKWLVGMQMSNCSADFQKSWTCELSSDRSQRAWIVWNPDRQLRFRLPQEWEVQQMRNLAGDRQLLSSNRVEIGPSPLLLEQRNR